MLCKYKNKLYFSKYVKSAILYIIMLLSLCMLSGCSDDKAKENTKKVSLFDKEDSFIEKIPIVGGVVKFTSKVFKFIIFIIVLIIIFIILYAVKLVKSVIGADSTTKQLKELNKNIKENNEIELCKSNNELQNKHSKPVNKLGVLDFKEVINKTKK